MAHQLHNLNVDRYGNIRSDEWNAVSSTNGTIKNDTAVVANICNEKKMKIKEASSTLVDATNAAIDAVANVISMSIQGNFSIEKLAAELLSLPIEELKQAIAEASSALVEVVHAAIDDVAQHISDRENIDDKKNAALDRSIKGLKQKISQFAVHDEEQMARTDRATGRPFSGGPLAVPVRPEEPPPQSPVPVAGEDDAALQVRTAGGGDALAATAGLTIPPPPQQTSPPPSPEAMPIPPLQSEQAGWMLVTDEDEPMDGEIVYKPPDPSPAATTATTAAAATPSLSPS
eukprot:EG_transcript_17423